MHVAIRQGPRVRNLGLRKTIIDLRKLSAVQTLEAVAKSLWGVGERRKLYFSMAKPRFRWRLAVA